MAEENQAQPDGPVITYTIVSLDAERWFVDSNKGTSGYSFHSLAEAERFAITLAQRNTPQQGMQVGQRRGNPRRTELQRADRHRSVSNVGNLLPARQINSCGGVGNLLPTLD